MRNTVDIMGVPVDSLTMQQAVDKVKQFLVQDKVHTVYTPNAEIMMEAQRDNVLRNILCEADMLVPDGAGVVLASRILGLYLPERVAGVDLLKNLFLLSGERKAKYFLLGGKPGVAETAAEKILEYSDGIIISGCRDGYFTTEQNGEIIEQINSSESDILLVALGAPKQEKWISEHKHELNVKVCIGVGGSLDIFAGTAKRAPEFFRKNNLEWLYRLCKEPRRFKRMLDLPRYILLALYTRLKNGMCNP